jgi:hypothetical protein
MDDVVFGCVNRCVFFSSYQLRIRTQLFFLNGKVAGTCVVTWTFALLFV